jgi:hypothetical protein
MRSILGTIPSNLSSPTSTPSSTRRKRAAALSLTNWRQEPRTRTGARVDAAFMASPSKRFQAPTRSGNAQLRACVGAEDSWTICPSNLVVDSDLQHTKPLEWETSTIWPFHGGFRRQQQALACGSFPLPDRKKCWTSTRCNSSGPGNGEKANITSATIATNVVNRVHTPTRMEHRVLRRWRGHDLPIHDAAEAGAPLAPPLLETK